MPSPSLRAEMWRNRWFYIFIGPFFIHFAAFGLYQVVFAFYLSFFKWDGMAPMRPLGLEHFVTLFQDPTFWAALRNTIILGLMYVPLMLFLALLFAVLLNRRRLYLRTFLRTAYFMPVVTPFVVVALIWGLFLGTDHGLINQILSLFGVSPIPWLTSEEWAKPSISICLIWRWTGYNMILVLAGLQGIPDSLYESAAIDGARAHHTLLHVTLPLLRPVLTFCLIMSIIGTFYLFDEIFVLTEGGPGIATLNIGVFLYRNAFEYLKFGYTSAMAYVVAALIFILSWTSFRLLGRRADQ